MKYLVIRFSSLGDCILLCPLLTALKSGGAEKVAVVTKEQYRDLFSAVPGVDEIYTLPKQSSIGDVIKLASSLKQSEYQVIDAHNSLRSRIFTFMMGVRPFRFDKRTCERLRLILYKSTGRVDSMLDRFTALGRSAGLDSAGIDTTGPSLELPAGCEDTLPPELRNGRKNFIALAPGSRWPMKRWGEHNYRQLAGEIIDRFNLRVVLLGDGGDRESNRRIAGELEEAAVDLTGTTSILEAAAALERVRALVSNDSGLMHLSEAVGTPVLGVFGPTVEQFGYFPRLPASKTCERRLGCRPCSRNGSRPCPLGTQECLAGIKVSSVLEIVGDLLSGTGPRRYQLP